MKNGLKAATLSVLSNAILVTLGYLLYLRVPYFNTILSPEVKAFLPLLGAMLILASVITAVFCLLNQSLYISDSLRVFVSIVPPLSRILSGPQTSAENLKAKRHQFLIVPVKLFYVPLMLQFAVGNFIFLSDYISSGRFIDAFSGRLPQFNYELYPFLIGLCFFIDTIFFLFGYLIYSKSLNNTVRSVDSSLLGWAAALLCYPPFNYFTSEFIPAMYRDSVSSLGQTDTFLLHLIMLFLLVIYTTATVNLGWKCSNLTNRGIVSHGVYSVIRHPAYIAKNLFWWISLVPIIPDKPVAALYMAGWTALYILRAITEERHLARDPDYVEYRKKVRYRFIPGLI